MSSSGWLLTYFSAFSLIFFGMTVDGLPSIDFFGLFSSLRSSDLSSCGWQLADCFLLQYYAVVLLQVSSPRATFLSPCIVPRVIEKRTGMRVGSVAVYCCLGIF